MLLEKGLKCNLHSKKKNWLTTLTLEAGTAIIQLPIADREYCRKQVADRIEKLQNNLNPQHTPHPKTRILKSSKVSKGLPQQAKVAQGVLGRLRPRIFLMFRHYKGGRLSAKCTSRLYPGINPWYSLSEAESTSGHMVLSGGTAEKIPSDTTGNRSRDCPTSSTVP